MTEPFEHDILEINLHKNSYQFTDNQWGCLNSSLAVKAPVLMENPGADKVIGVLIGIQKIDSLTNKIRLLLWPRFSGCLTSDLRLTNLEFDDNNIIYAIYMGVKSQNEQI